MLSHTNTTGNEKRRGAEEIEIMEEEPYSLSFSGTTEVDISTKS